MRRVEGEADGPPDSGGVLGAGGAAEPLLSANGLKVHFEGVRALDGVDLELRKGEILGLIGPNGAGKTTLVNVMTGYQRPSHGSVRLGGRDITRLSPDARARHGVVRTFQSVRPFPRLTLLENVELSAASGAGSRREARRIATDLLVRFGLGDRARDWADSLPAGDARAVGIARALALRPALLLLDEPAAGMNDHETAWLVEMLRAIRAEFDLGLLVIEHDMRVIMPLCERIQVLDHGVTLAVGTPEEVRRNEAVLEAYLGSSGGERADG